MGRDGAWMLWNLVIKKEIELDNEIMLWVSISLTGAKNYDWFWMKNMHEDNSVVLDDISTHWKLVWIVADNK